MRTICTRLVLALLLSNGALIATSHAAAAGAKTAAAGKAAEEEKVIEGVTINRPGDAFLGLQVVNGNFVLSFYDKDKNKVAPDRIRASLRWPVKYQPNDERAVLQPGADGTSLTSSKVVRPPFAFRVYVSLFVEGTEEPVESYSIDFHQ